MHVTESILLGFGVGGRDAVETLGHTPRTSHRPRRRVSSHWFTRIRMTVRVNTERPSASEDRELVTLSLISSQSNLWHTVAWGVVRSWVDTLDIWVVRAHEEALLQLLFLADFGGDRFDRLQSALHTQVALARLSWREELMMLTTVTSEKIIGLLCSCVKTTLSRSLVLKAVEFWGKLSLAKA